MTITIQLKLTPTTKLSREQRELCIYIPKMMICSLSSKSSSKWTEVTKKGTTCTLVHVSSTMGSKANHQHKATTNHLLMIRRLSVLPTIATSQRKIWSPLWSMCPRDHLRCYDNSTATAIDCRTSLIIQSNIQHHHQAPAHSNQSNVLTTLNRQIKRLVTIQGKFGYALIIVDFWIFFPICINLPMSGMKKQCIHHIWHLGNMVFLCTIKGGGRWRIHKVFHHFMIPTCCTSKSWLQQMHSHACKQLIGKT